MILTAYKISCVELRIKLNRYTMNKKELIEIIEGCVINSQVLINENVCFDTLRNELNNEIPEQLILSDVSSMLVANDMPAFGTKEFNDMCSNFFGGKSKSN